MKNECTSYEATMDFALWDIETFDQTVKEFDFILFFVCFVLALFFLIFF